MAISGFLHMILGFADIPDKVVEDIDASMPALSRLCKTAKLLRPVLEEALPQLEVLYPQMQALLNSPVKMVPMMIGPMIPTWMSLQPLLQQAMVIADPELGDAASVAPVIGEIIDLINSKLPGGAGKELGGGVE